ncbi:YkgJ family cysteine cluster protein [Methanochimaera problematica]|uniref:YkgJ family cysteine cluster protein n=1 Tax=Methanochimaera problematica TaxID=2609417 RepID=UPI00293941D2|nr:YkgJ family cysteine cluster protein [Methanoplanus sp. FWC-SCC4]
MALEDLEKEFIGLSSYPEEELEKIIKEVGFKCTMCGKCCTKEFNDHVFLLQKDLRLIKEKNQEAIVPAPYFEICDQNGIFYVSGYALRCKENGDCIFLKDNRCTRYDLRFSICRIYPYMLHRETDENGKTDWRQISGLNQHGEYNDEISGEECKTIAKETIEYEKEFLLQELNFLKILKEHFLENNLKPLRKVYDEKMRDFQKGKKIRVMVFNGEDFEKCEIKKEDYFMKF